MARAVITNASIMQHVRRLEDEHRPLRLDSVDRTIRRPHAVIDKFAPVIDYLARVELEVDRNVLELLTVLPRVKEVDRYFYQDVWQPQEVAHGLILDRLQADLGVPPAEPYLEITMPTKLLGALAHVPAIQEVARFMYYLTGASTERQAVLAYNNLSKGLSELGEPAIATTIIGPIKQQEPGHFAYYSMSATRMIQDGDLAPWQLYLAKTLRSKSFTLVGSHTPRYQADMGGVMFALDLDDKLEQYARDIGRLEAKLLWANENGMQFPPYFLEALNESVELFRERGFGFLEGRTPNL